MIDHLFSLGKAPFLCHATGLTHTRAHLSIQLEPDQNGLINYVEYVNMMMND